MSDVTIKDLYAGKPDAKDELYFDGADSFIKTFVLAEHFNIDSLISGHHCFITGFKGTGKTALLFYLDAKLRVADEATCSSFILFKEDFTDVRRNELQELSRRVQSSITVEPGALTGTTEFEYIWRWIMFKQIVSDNELYSRNLFVDNEQWRAFEKTIAQIRDPRDSRKIVIPNKIRLAIPFKDPGTAVEVTPEFEVDFQKQDSKPFRDFTTLVDQAEQLFLQLTRTDIPYYIFVDELEAYYGNPDIFNRDLYMIRDLVFTVKRFNAIFARVKMPKTKMLCSVRSEILTAISRFTVTKEINKIISGFSTPLDWNYSNSNSYAHPIIQILLKRIAVCSNEEDVPSLEIYRRWFPETIRGMEPASYILNNSWCKPRDIVRLITTAQNSLYNRDRAFKNSVFNAITKAYSLESLLEIKEELRALYTSEEIDSIISCFTGFRTVFSLADLNKRIQHLFSGTVLETNLMQVLNDLYRLGFLGNFLPRTQVYRWHHKGDSSVILSDEWRLFVHYALHSALSLGARNNRGLQRDVQVGDVTLATVYRVITHFALVEFELFGQRYRGSIHIGEFGKRENTYIHQLSSIVEVGDQLKVSLMKYDEEHANWKLELLCNDE